MSKSIPSRNATAAIAALATITLALSGCSSSTGSPSSSGSEAPSKLSDEAQQRLDALYEGTSVEPPSDAPAPGKDKSIWVISLGQGAEAIAAQAAGVRDAGESLGWKTTIFDGKYEPNTMLAGVQQAVAARADGIVLASVDCSIVKTGLEAAKRADIPVVGIESQDCDPSLESVIGYAEGDFTTYGKAFGSDAALWLIAQGGTKFIELKETDAQATLNESAGFQASLAENCPDCENVVVEFTAGDLGPNLQEMVQQTLLRNPDAAGMFVPYDDVVTSSVASAVTSSGRDDFDVISAGGTTAGMDLIRQNRGLTADLVLSCHWEGYAAVDWLIRLMNGQQPTPETVSTGIGSLLVDADHNLPDSGLPDANVDYAAAYEEAWGVVQ